MGNTQREKTKRTTFKHFQKHTYILVTCSVARIYSRMTQEGRWIEHTHSLSYHTHVRYYGIATIFRVYFASVDFASAYNNMLFYYSTYSSSLLPVETRNTIFLLSLYSRAV